jgi:hypothetical protein
MALPSETIELIERMAERLEKWAKGWGKQMLKNKPENLRQFRASLLAISGDTSFPEFAFRMEFYAGLNTALERFDYVKEELQHYMPDMATMVQKKHEDLVSKAKPIGQMALDDPTCFKRFVASRNLAKDLARTLRHIVEIDTRESKAEMAQVNVELDLAERLLIIGTNERRISSELVWDFLKTLAFNTKRDRFTPRIDSDKDWKNAVDVLRRQIGKSALHQVVTSAKGGYYLAGSVKTKYGGQAGIRRTSG